MTTLEPVVPVILPLRPTLTWMRKLNWDTGTAPKFYRHTNPHIQWQVNIHTRTHTHRDTYCILTGIYINDYKSLRSSDTAQP